MQTMTTKKADRKLSLLRRFRLWMMEYRMRDLRSESAYCWAEIERCKARIVAMDSELIRTANAHSALRLK